MADISTSVAGVRMRSPIGVGAIGAPLIKPGRLTVGQHAELLLKDVEAGAGFISLPSSRHIPPDMVEELKKRAKPLQTKGIPIIFRFLEMHTDGVGTEGLYLACTPATQHPEKSARRFVEHTGPLIEILKRKRPKNVPMIANLSGMAGFPESFVTGAVEHEKAGVELIEINVSAALGAAQDHALEYYEEKNFPLSGGGVLIGDQPELVEEITRHVVKAVNVPVGVKVSPETGFPRIVELARRIKAAGGQFITCSNNAVAIPPPDIYHGGRSKLPFMEDNPFVAGSGSWMRPIIYKQVASISKYVPGIDVIALGGISSPVHVVEAMMLGAKAVGTVTGMIFSGRKLLKRQERFLAPYMKAQGYRCTSDFIGLGLKFFKPAEQIDFQPGKIAAEIDPAKCTGCGRCTDHVCLATTMDGRIAKVKEDDCLGCGMCTIVCRVGAVSLKQKA
ncbi:MAG: hypothetical protein HYX83_03050 [Chloroflexi bacterium]|nr:hypothetical protein [Chloroflexota bacterium]